MRNKGKWGSYKVRNSRYRLLMTILYNRQFNRPTSDTVETNITQLGQLSGISRTHHTRDNMLWLEDMQYISDVENQYGLVRFRINTELIVAAPEAATAGSGSPSDCARTGGLIIGQPSNLEQVEEPISEEEYNNLIRRESCQIKKKPEEEVEDPKVHSERSQKNSTSPTVKKLKLKPRFTTE